MRRRLWVAGAVLVALALAVGGLLWWRDGRPYVVRLGRRARAGRHPARVVDRLGGGPRPRAVATCRPTSSTRRPRTASCPRPSTTTSAPPRRWSGRHRSSSSASGSRPRPSTGSSSASPTAGAVVMLHVPTPDARDRAGPPPRAGVPGAQRRARRLGRRAGRRGRHLRRTSPRSCPTSPSTVTTPSSWPPTRRRSWPSPCRRCSGDGSARRRGSTPWSTTPGEPLSAAVYTGDYACGALAMAHAGAADQAEARRLLAAAGRGEPLLRRSRCLGRARRLGPRRVRVRGLRAGAGERRRAGGPGPRTCPRSGRHLRRPLPASTR